MLLIVARGVIEHLYVDTYCGRKADMAPTMGNPSNARVGTGAQSLEELLKEEAEGIYVTSSLGGNADGTRAASRSGRGHMIENRAIGRSIGEMNVSGKLRTNRNIIQEDWLDDQEISFSGGGIAIDQLYNGMTGLGYDIGISYGGGGGQCEYEFECDGNHECILTATGDC